MLLSEPVSPEITILTPTFNRLHLLPRLYQSLVAQEAPRGTFEWLVVDDGSTDGTEDWLSETASKAPFPIFFIKRENGGKYKALNIGADHANGAWQIVVDSDDLLLPAALASIRHTIAKHGTKHVAMFAGLFEFSKQSKERVSIPRTAQSFSVPRNPCRYFEWVDYQGQFDFVPIIRSDIARANKFPERPEERYFPESWRYYKISEKSDCYFMNEKLARAEYQNNGLSFNSLALRIDSALNTRDANLEAFSKSQDYRFKFKKALNAIRFGLHGNGSRSILNELPLCYLFLFPFSFLIYLTDRLRRS